MKLRLTFLIPAAAGLALAAAFFAAPRIARSAVVDALQKAVPGSAVSVGSCRFTPGGPLILEDVRLALETPSKNFPRLRAASSGKGLLPLLVPAVVVKDMRPDIRTADLALSGTLSFTRDMRSSAFRELTLDIRTLTLGGGAVSGLWASTDAPGAGRFGAAKISFDKFAAENLEGRFALSDAGVLLDGVRADLLGGRARAKLTAARLGDAPVVTAEADLQGIPIASVLRLWEWDKKCAADGRVGGHLLAEFSAGKLSRLEGALVAEGGGDLVVLDQRFLENIAERSKQPIEIVKASFENYHYNSGTVGISLQENGLRLGLDLEGEQGKRDLEVTLHDWF